MNYDSPTFPPHHTLIEPVNVSSEVDDPIDLLSQPDTRPITAEQLVNEVKGIYAGLVMVEKKCVEIIAERSTSGVTLSNDQWQALIALHRTLLHEHYDFFLAPQHSTASPALRRLANKYAMPARMWRNGIHAFLELLRQQLPGFYDHMLAFVYVAYSMMALLKESVPSFLDAWIECLEDLARYRMAIEETDIRIHDWDIWSNVAKIWYREASHQSPDRVDVGRSQHHLAMLARPNIVKQLFYYSKALVAVVPFVNARDSIMLLFEPFLDKDRAEAQHLECTPAKLPFLIASATFLTEIDDHSRQSSTRYKTQGPEITTSLIAGIMDYGSQKNVLCDSFKECVHKVHSISSNQYVPMVLSRQRATQRLSRYYEALVRCLSWVWRKYRTKIFSLYEHASLMSPPTPRRSAPNSLRNPSLRLCAYLLLPLAWFPLLATASSALQDGQQSEVASIHRRSLSRRPGPDSDAHLVDDAPSNFLQLLLTTLLTWTPSLIAATLVLLYGMKQAIPNPIRIYRSYSLASAIASVVLLDVRTAPQIRYPTMAVCLFFHLRYTLALFPDLLGGFGLAILLFGATITSDASICKLSAPSQGVDTNLFLSLFLPSGWLVLTGTYELPKVIWQIRRYIARALDDQRDGPDLEAGAGSHELTTMTATESNEG